MHDHEFFELYIAVGTGVTLFLSMQFLGYAVVRHLNRGRGMSADRMETKMSDQPKNRLGASHLVPLNRADMLQVERQASLQEQAEIIREPQRRSTPGLRAARRRWRFAFGRYKR